MIITGYVITNKTDENGMHDIIASFCRRNEKDARLAAENYIKEQHLENDCYIASLNTTNQYE